jgi:hypothetical protein
MITRERFDNIGEWRGLGLVAPIGGKRTAGGRESDTS